MTIATYEARLKDQSGAVVARFFGAGRGLTGGGMQSFRYEKLVRKPGRYSLALYGNDERISAFELDGQIEFWRRDLAGGLDWYLDYEGFHRFPDYTQDEEGREIFMSHGVGYNCLLASETIQYPAGSAQSCKGPAPAETIAKAFVNENIGPGAGVDGLALTRVRPGLAIEADAAGGANWTGCRAYRNLIDVLVELGWAAPADFMVVGTGAATFEFQWAADQWGLDKTVGNGVRPSVTFSASAGNVERINHGYNRINETNICYVLGAGLTTTRLIRTRQDAALLGGSPWARRAVARDARDEDVNARLDERGDEVLEKEQPRRTLDFMARQIVATRYGRDWDLGDLVSVEYWEGLINYRVSVKIASINVSMSTDGTETIAPVVEAVGAPAVI